MADDVGYLNNPRKPNNPFGMDPESYKICKESFLRHIEFTLTTDNPSEPGTRFDPLAHREFVFVRGLDGVLRIEEI